jgi:indolepyruvate ferredoxin oxidoreductase beta subunit
LISSSHRVFAISEKSAMGDGRLGSDKIIDAAHRRAGSVVLFDMEEAAEKAGSVISSIMLGALAGSRALPFSGDHLRQAIVTGGKAVDANLRGFEAGLAGSASGAVARPAAPRDLSPPLPEILCRRIKKELPVQAQSVARIGAARLCDYLDQRYAAQYLDRLRDIVPETGGSLAAELTGEVARHLALWMSYEDTIRVADLKTRASRFARVSAEVRATSAQHLDIVEFMHPRLQEICETLPARIGSWLLASPRLSGWLGARLRHGKKIRTTSLRGFLLLYSLASLRRFRRGTLRYQMEQKHIERWLALIVDAARTDRPLAMELARCQRLVKGYGDTLERGLTNYERIVAVIPQLPQNDRAKIVAELCSAALSDEEGTELNRRIEALAA